MATSSVLAADALLGLLLPLWQLVIGILVVIAVAMSILRLIRRGPSRMATAMLFFGGAVVCLTVLGILLQDVAQDR